MKDYIQSFADDNPIDIDLVEELGPDVFPNRKAVSSWIARLEAAGYWHCVGTRKDSRGRKSLKVYCNSWKPKDDNLRHECIGSHVRHMYRSYECDRGFKINDCFPDLVLRNGERVFEIEIDCGSLKHKAVVARWKRHTCDRDILVVAAPEVGDPEARMRRLMSWSKGLGDRGFFTTLERLKQYGPHARVWDYLDRGNRPLRRVPQAVAYAFQPLVHDTPQLASVSDHTEVCIEGN